MFEFQEFGFCLMREIRLISHGGFYSDCFHCLNVQGVPFFYSSIAQHRPYSNDYLRKLIHLLLLLFFFVFSFLEDNKHRRKIFLEILLLKSFVLKSASSLPGNLERILKEYTTYIFSSSSSCFLNIKQHYRFMFFKYFRCVY